MSFLIKDNKVIAKVADRESGDVMFSYVKTKEDIDANREFNLVNAQHGKISNAKKWESAKYYDFGKEINKDEYFIY